MQTGTVMNRETMMSILPRLLFMSMVLLLLVLIGTARHANGAPVLPYYTNNQAPLHVIFGFPAPGNAEILQRGGVSAMVTTEISNHFSIDSNGYAALTDSGGGVLDNMLAERITLDGETYRIIASLRYGFGNGIEGGIEVPYMAMDGGFLDDFIEGFHKTFNLPNQNRARNPQDRFLYKYTKNGTTLLYLDDPGSGVGDVRLTGGIQLYNNHKPNPRQLALRTSVKLPTGSTSKLHGSGSTDLALWLTAADDYQLPKWGHLTLFGSAGGMAMTRGKVIKDKQRNSAWFGTFGLGWGPAEWLDIKAQLMANTSAFRGDVWVVEKPGLMVVGGFTLNFTDRTALDVGVGEDVIVKTSPDVTFHLTLRRTF